VFWTWNNNRSVRRAELRRKPCLEALEDRYVLSTASTAPVVELVAYPITTYAGQSFSGSVARVDSQSVAGLTSTIQWNSVQESAGAFTNVASNTFAISGTVTFAQPGSYTMVVSVASPSGNLATAQATVTVLMARNADNAASYVPSSVPAVAGTPDGNLTFSTEGASVNLGLVVQVEASGSTSVSAAGLGVKSNPPPLPQSPPTATQNQAGANPPPNHLSPPASSPLTQTLTPFQWSPPAPATGPGRIVTTDFVVWSSTRDQGLNQPLSGLPAAPAATDYVSWSSIGEHADGSMPVSPVIPPLPVLTLETSATASLSKIPVEAVTATDDLPGSMVSVSFDTPASALAFRLIVDSQVHSPARSTLVGAEVRNPDGTGVEERSHSVAAVQNVYHQPLFRIADRSELGGLSGPLANAAAVAAIFADRNQGLSAAVPPLARERNRADVEELEPPDKASHLRFASQPTTSGSLAEAAAVWAIFQSLHAADLPPATARNVALAKDGAAQPGKDVRGER
jgi:hypothetical protein